MAYIFLSLFVITGMADPDPLDTIDIIINLGGELGESGNGTSPSQTPRPPGVIPESSSENESARKFIEKAEPDLTEKYIPFRLAAYDVAYNSSEERIAKKNKLGDIWYQTQENYIREAQKFNQSEISDPDVKRKIKMLVAVDAWVDIPESRQNDDESMGSIRDSVQVMDRRNENESVDMFRAMSNFRQLTAEDLKFYWEQHREPTRKMPKLFEKWLENERRVSQVSPPSGSWINRRERDVIEKLWDSILPFYKQFHAYIRTKLNIKFGDQVVGKTGSIPMHILGNPWGTFWFGINRFVKPYPSKPSLSQVSKNMFRLNWTSIQMYEAADDLFHSMGMLRAPKQFWTDSLLEVPKDRRYRGAFDCNPRAYQFMNKKDFRITYCGGFTNSDFNTVFHEMGHIQHYMKSKEQSFLFKYLEKFHRGFHESVGYMLTLAAASPTYKKRLGLIDSNADFTDQETIINFLMDQALDLLPMVPFNYLYDKFRWDAIDNLTDISNFNCYFWQQSHELMGMRPPSKRSKDHLDMAIFGAFAYHDSIIRYFHGFIINYSGFKGLCQEAGQYVPGDPSKPLHLCDLYGSKEAGKKFSEFLSLGISLPYQEILEKLAGIREFDAVALLEYFKPLEDWLQAENARTGTIADWGPYKAENTCGAEAAPLTPRIIKKKTSRTSGRFMKSRRSKIMSHGLRHGRPITARVSHNTESRNRQPYISNTDGIVTHDMGRTGIMHSNVIAGSNRTSRSNDKTGPKLRNENADGKGSSSNEKTGRRRRNGIAGRNNKSSNEKTGRRLRNVMADGKGSSSDGRTGITQSNMVAGKNSKGRSSNGRSGKLHSNKIAGRKSKGRSSNGRTGKRHDSSIARRQLMQ